MYAFFHWNESIILILARVHKYTHWNEKMRDVWCWRKTRIIFYHIYLFTIKQRDSLVYFNHFSYCIWYCLQLVHCIGKPVKVLNIKRFTLFVASPYQYESSVIICLMRLMYVHSRMVVHISIVFIGDNEKGV